MISKQTTLDLNGPILSFTTQPIDVTVDNAGIATFIGIATATFPTQTPANIFSSNTGIVTHRWYAAGIGALSDGSNTTLKATLSGTATTTLTVSSVTSPTTNEIQFFVGADYIPSAYQSSSPVTAGTGRSTGNAINEELFSNNATLTVNPIISITVQPGIATVAQGRTATFSVTASSSDNTSVSYQWYIAGSPVSNGTSGGNTISGANTNTLTIVASADTPVATSNVYVSVSHPTAGNSPVTSDTVTLNVVSARAIINFENFGEGTPSLTGSGSINLFNNPLLINADSTISARSNCIYAPERDIRVRITMAGSRGNGRNGYRAGYGGVSIFEMTLLQNVEYVFKLGTPTGFGGPGGGANGGGGIAVLYRQGNVLVVCGGGGGAGTSGRGGDGGGIGVGGENGQGRDNGAGGYSIQTGTLDMSGSFAGGTQAGPTSNPIYKTGGKLSKCTIGDYWRNRGVSPCSTMGNVQAFTYTGTAISGSTSSIIRGYKAGIAYRNNGGNGSGNEGGGGAGVVGGNAATGSGAGGGGASGYSSGEVTIVSTQRGGNDGFAYAYIELLS